MKLQKNLSLETMYLFAHASDGVSADENEVIDYLTKELGLERNQDIIS